MTKKSDEIRKENLELLKKSFPELFQLEVSYFHTFMCPVAIAEAMVKEHIVEDYDFFELLILRLYELGFRSVEELSSLSGMNQDMVAKALYNEQAVYGHIDSEGNITEMGQKTLADNKAGRRSSADSADTQIVHHAMYLTPRRIQIEAATGTVIPGYLEEKTENMRKLLADKVDGVVPRESVQQDEELRREINERLQEYKHKDILNEGDTICGIERLVSTQIFYRWAYLLKLNGMTYPMIVLKGRKTIENVNRLSRETLSYGKTVAWPLAIAESDARLLKRSGIDCSGLLVRKDECFAFLNEKIADFDFQHDADYEIEEEAVAYEDELVLESEDLFESEDKK